MSIGYDAGHLSNDLFFLFSFSSLFLLFLLFSMQIIHSGTVFSRGKGMDKMEGTSPIHDDVF